MTLISKMIKTILILFTFSICTQYVAKGLNEQFEESKTIEISSDILEHMSKLSYVISGSMLGSIIATGAIILNIFGKGIYQTGYQLQEVSIAIFSDQNYKLIYKIFVISLYTNMILLLTIASINLFDYLVNKILNKFSKPTEIKQIKLKQAVEYHYDIDSNDKIISDINEHIDIITNEVPKHTVNNPKIIHETNQTINMIIEKHTNEIMNPTHSGHVEEEQPIKEEEEQPIKEEEEQPIKEEHIVEEEEQPIEEEEEQPIEEEEEQIIEEQIVEEDKEELNDGYTEDNEEDTDETDADYVPSSEEIEEGKELLSPSAMVVPFKGKMYYMDDETGKVYNAININNTEEFIPGKEVGTCSMGAITLYDTKNEFKPIFG